MDIEVKGSEKPHESAYFDDTDNIKNIMFKLTSSGVMIVDEIYDKIRQEFLEFHYMETDFYTEILNSEILSITDATDMRLHRITYNSENEWKSKLEGKLERRGFELSTEQIDELLKIMKEVRYEAPSVNYVKPVIQDVENRGNGVGVDDYNELASASS